MVKKNTISVIGGDTRQLYAAEYLESTGYDVKIFGCEHGKPSINTTICNDLTEAFSAEIILLPLPVSKNAKILNTPLSSNEITLKTISDLILDEHKVFLGMGQQTFIKQLKAKTDYVYDYYKNEDLILKNALLTAEGILSIITERLPVSIFGLKTAITGFGRIATFTADKMHKLGADVTIFARNSLQLTKAHLLGIKAVNLTYLNHFASDFECIINTVPSPVITEYFIKNTKPDCLFIETASPPYGIDFNACINYNKNLVKAFSLPGKTSPKSAGIVIGETVDNCLREVN